MHDSSMNEVRDLPHTHTSQQIRNNHPHGGSDTFCHNINSRQNIGQFHHSSHNDREVNRYIHLTGHTGADDSRVPLKRDDDILHGRNNVPYSSSISDNSSTASSAISTSTASFSSFSSRTSDRSIPSYGFQGHEPQPHWSTGSTGGYILPPSNNTTMEYTSAGNPDRGYEDVNLAARVEPTPSEIKDSVLRSHDVKIKLSSTKMLQPEDALYDAACPLGTSPIDLNITDSHPIPVPVPSSLLKSGHKVVSAKQLRAYKLFKKRIEVKLPSPSLDLYATCSDTNTNATPAASSVKNEGKANAIPLQFFPELCEFGTSSSSNSSSSSSSNNNNSNSNNNDNNNNIRFRSRALQTIDIEAVAVLSMCRRYEGEALEDCGPVVNLSLEIACEPLTQYLQTRHVQQQAEITRENIDIWFSHLFDHIATLSDSLNTCVM